MRNLVAARKLILRLIPEGELRDRVAARTKSVADSYYFRAPEVQWIDWHEFASVLYDTIGDAPSGWRADVWALVRGEE